MADPIEVVLEPDSAAREDASALIDRVLDLVAEGRFDAASIFATDILGAWQTLQRVAQSEYLARLSRLDLGQRKVLERELWLRNRFPVDQVATNGALGGFLPQDLYADHQPQPYITRHMAEPGELIIIFGESGAMKSFFVLDWFLSVAAGQDYCGHKVNQTGVLYIAGEGGQGLRRRVRAWLINQGMGVDSDGQPAIYVATQPANLLFDGGTIDATLQLAQQEIGCDIGVVVFDTLTANFGPGDEAKTEDMQRALECARTACGDRAIVLVHHVGHADKSRERGAYALRGAADRRYIVERPDMGPLVVVKNLKAKDDAPVAALTFEWKVIPIGWLDIDGDELTSVVLQPSTKEPPAHPAALTKVQRCVMTLLGQAHREGRAVTKAAIANQVKDLGHNRSYAYKAISQLMEAGLVVEGMDRIQLVDVA